jgi:cytochrome P450
MTSPSIPLTVAPRFHKQWLLAQQKPIQYCNEIRRDYGDFVHVRGLFDAYLINHPELVGQILLNKDRKLSRIDEKNKIYARLRNLGRSGIASSDEERWEKQRRLLAPAFTPAVIRGFGETMLRSAQAWATRWALLNGTVFDIRSEMSKLSLDVTSKCFLAADTREDYTRLADWLATMGEYMQTMPYPVVGDWWFPSPLNLRTKMALAAFDAYAMRLLHERRRANLDPNSKDIMARMIHARDPETGRAMTDEEICHEILTLFSAGYESTAASLLWAFYHLSQNSDVEAKVHRELDDVLDGRPLALEDLPRLTYTKRFIDEVMRISPSIFFTARTALEDIELGGNPIRRGSFLMVSISTLHHHPMLWPDPARFDPDRFLPDAVAARPPNAYVPFSRGPHTCIGNHFALQELLIVTAQLASQFRVVMEPQRFDPDDVCAGLSVYPRRGLRMRALPRAAVTERVGAA